jgi:hypothetical protein
VKFKLHCGFKSSINPPLHVVNDHSLAGPERSNQVSPACATNMSIENGNHNSVCNPKPQNPKHTWSGAHHGGCCLAHDEVVVLAERNLFEGWWGVGGVRV